MSEKASQSIGADKSVPDKTFFSRDDVLQASNETFYSRIASLANQFAILGYTDTAANLVGKLNTYNWYHGQQAVVRPLRILWEQTNHWPDGELDRVREEIQNQRQRAAKEKVTDEQGEETGKKIKLQVNESPITRQDVKKDVDDLCQGLAICWWYPERPMAWSNKGVEVPPGPHHPGVDLSVEELRKKIRDFVNAFHGWEEPEKHSDAVKGHEPAGPSSLISALELRAKLREKTGDDDSDVPSEIDILSIIAKRLEKTRQLDTLLQSRRAWPFLRDGAILKILNINKPALDHFAAHLEAAISERLETGKQPFPALSIKELVNTINKNTLTNPESIEFIKERNADIDGEFNIPSTILHSPASESLIADTEKRLDVTLPDDYKKYLRITNGHDDAWGGIIAEPPLWKCNDIRWFADHESYFSDLVLDVPANMSGVMHSLSGDGSDWPKLGRGLIVGQEDVDHVFLVKPASINAVKEKVKGMLEGEATQEVKDSVRRSVEDFAGSVESFEKLEWCTVAWSDTEMECFSSFEAYLRDVALKGKEKERDGWNLGYGEFFGGLFVEGGGGKGDCVAA